MPLPLISTVLSPNWRGLDTPKRPSSLPPNLPPKQRGHHRVVRATDIENEGAQARPVAQWLERSPRQRAAGLLPRPGHGPGQVRSPAPVGVRVGGDQSMCLSLNLDPAQPAAGRGTGLRSSRGCHQRAPFPTAPACDLRIRLRCKRSRFVHRRTSPFRETLRTRLSPDGPRGARFSARCPRCLPTRPRSP